MPWVAERAPEGWRATDQRGVAAEDLGYEPYHLLGHQNCPDPMRMDVGTRVREKRTPETATVR